MEVSDSEAQGRRREAGSERSVEQRPRADEQEPDEEAYGSGRAGKIPRSPDPSRLLVVNPAVARRRRSNLPREVCDVSRNRD